VDDRSDLGAGVDGAHEVTEARLLVGAIGDVADHGDRHPLRRPVRCAAGARLDRRDPGEEGHGTIEATESFLTCRSMAGT
jgi:hypothetical protein